MPCHRRTDVAATGAADAAELNVAGKMNCSLNSEQPTVPTDDSTPDQRRSVYKSKLTVCRHLVEAIGHPLTFNC
jgi:hypothetical protein